MKAPFQEKKIGGLKIDLESKQGLLKTETEKLFQYIKDKCSSDLIEAQITRRNLLFIDISNIEAQIQNLKKGRRQYGDCFQEQNVRRWID